MADIHMGWLQKKSGGKAEQEASKKKSFGQVRNKWDRRFMVLLPGMQSDGSVAGGSLMYFKHDSDWSMKKEPKGTINMDDAELLLGEGSELEFAVRCTKPPPSHAIGGGLSLAFPPRVYVFRAESAEGLAGFVGALSSVISKVQRGVDGKQLQGRAASAIQYTHGFTTNAAEDQQQKSYAGKVAKQQKEWFAFFRSQQKRSQVVAAARKSEHDSLLAMDRPSERLCRGGIPPQWRGQMWSLLSGSAAARQRGLGRYEEYQRQELPEAVVLQIEKDLPRTFSDNGVLAERTEQLRRLLRAYAAYDTEVGYCQSLNYLAAILMLYMDEEGAFWALQRTVQWALPAGYYTDGMVGLRTDHKVLSALVERCLPRLSAHLTNLGVPLEPISTQWLLCMYLNVLPMECVLRIWDVVFAEGGAVLLRIAMALLAIHEDTLCACVEMTDVMMALQSMTSGGAETQTVDIEKIMGTAFGAKALADCGPAEIAALRGQFLVEIQREDAENEKSAAARAAAQQARREAKQEAEAKAAAAAAAATAAAAEAMPSDESLASLAGGVPVEQQSWLQVELPVTPRPGDHCDGASPVASSDGAVEEGVPPVDGGSSDGAYQVWDDV